MENIKLNTDYLKFDAFSIKELIKQKLSTDTSFTDFVYEGSNLSILIDIFSNMFQVLMYNLNHTASESMFIDTQIYENINRLVKFIGYSPRGYSTANILVTIPFSEERFQGTILPPYSYIRLSKQNKDGNPVICSTVDYRHLYFNAADSNAVTLYNGQWIKYGTVFTAQGIPYEKIILTELISDSTAYTPTYIAHPYVHVYIKRRISDNAYETIKYEPNVEGLLVNVNNTELYNSRSKIFALRVNEYKQYEIQFGDGIYGEALMPGDLIYVVYLRSDGPDGIININDITPSNLIITGISNISDTVLDDKSILTFPDILYAWFKDHITIVNQEYTDLYVESSNASTTPLVEETVEEIKTNAPHWFKAIGGISTIKDFEFFVRSNYYNDVIDVKVMNNWEYICTLYKWLYLKGLSSPNNPSPSKYINHSLVTNYGYKYADAADSNNVYLWIKSKNEGVTSLFNSIDEALRPLKQLTCEPVFMVPLKKMFFPCAFINEQNPTNYDIDLWDSSVENYIEVEIDRNILISLNSVKSLVATYIVDFFAAQNQKIGAIVDIAGLVTKVLSIQGIKGLKTVFVDPTDASNVKYINGLSFACWTYDILMGEDATVVNSSYALESFQFPELAGDIDSITSHIKVITDSVYHSNHVEY